MWSTIKDIIGMIFGASKWPMFILIISIISLGIYSNSKISALQTKLKEVQGNYDTVKNNNEKLEKAKKEQDQTIAHLKNLLVLSDGITSDLVKNINKRSSEINKLKQKLVVVTPDVAVKKPVEFEAKVNETMNAINHCFEDLSQKDVNDVSQIIDDEIVSVTEEKKDEEKPKNNCSVDELPNFGGLY